MFAEIPHNESLYQLRALVFERQGCPQAALEDAVRALLVSEELNAVCASLARVQRRACAQGCVRLWVLAALASLARRVRSDAKGERAHLDAALALSPDEEALKVRLARLTAPQVEGRTS
jgi:hypothetical protein